VTRALRLANEMRDSLAGYWRQRTGCQTMLYVVGMVMLISGVLHTVVYLVTGGSWDGPLSWRKPMLFGYSFGVTEIALAWIVTFLPARRRPGWWLLGGFAASSTVEVLLITAQTWRGVPSHFNFSAPPDVAISVAMSVLASVFATVLVIITVWTFRPLAAPTDLAWAIRAGMVLLSVGQALGGLIIAVGVSQVFGPPAQNTVFGAEGVLLGPAGVLKLPHAIALHGLQVLPALAWLASFTRWGERARRRAAAVAIAGYSCLVATSLLQTLAGRAPFDLLLPALVALVAGAGMLLGVLVAVLAGLVRSGLRERAVSGSPATP
jgi:hypothetical protein